MSAVVVVSVTIVLVLTSRPTHPRPALVLADTLGAYRRAATSGGPFSFHRPALAIKVRPGAPPRSTRAARASGYRDPLASHRATVGPDVRTSWLTRLKAIILLVLIVASIGIAIAGVTLLVIASGRFFLELLAG